MCSKRYIQVVKPSRLLAITSKAASIVNEAYFVEQ